MNNDDMKKAVLADMQDWIRGLDEKLNILSALDKDSSTSGYNTMSDQLTAMTEALDVFEEYTHEALNIARYYDPISLEGGTYQTVQ